MSRLKSKKQDTLDAVQAGTCTTPSSDSIIALHLREEWVEAVSYTHLTLPTIYSV